MAEGEREVGSCNERVTDNDKSDQGPTKSVLASEQMGDMDGRYGPWVMGSGYAQEERDKESEEW